MKRKIAEFAFVEELVPPELRKRSFGGLFGGRAEAPRWNPFLCEGKIVELAMDDRDALSAVGDNHPSSQSKPSEFLVTPRFDLTLEEYLQQTNISSVDSRWAIVDFCEAWTDRRTRIHYFHGAGYYLFRS